MDGMFIGQIILVAFNYVPEDFAACDGSIMKVENNQALFSLLGYQFGGDYKNNTFALPKIDSPFPGTHYIICTSGIYPPRQ